MRNLTLRLLASLAVLWLLAMSNGLEDFKPSPAAASHGPFTISSGIYRVPYADGLTVTAFNDHHTHPNAFDRVDMGAGEGSVIVAAASGIIRGIVDYNGDYFGRGDGVGSDGSTLQDDSLEDNCTGDGNAALVESGSCSNYNNYVWIEHPNGEWTKYTHMKTGTVTIDYGWSVGDTILVGQALGLEGDVGAAAGFHLHFEVGVPNDPTDATPFGDKGGFITGVNRVTQVCFLDGDDDGDSLYTQGESYTAGPCVNTAPTADAGGPYLVNEGSDLQLDATGSMDPENAILSYSWAPGAALDDPTSATPTFSGIDDGVTNLTLTVSDIGGDVTAATELTDNDSTSVTVLNVDPTVVATGDSIDEAGTATVSATFSDPGTLDTHTATIDWDDGSALEATTVVQLASGIEHVYGDNGTYDVTVTVTDDDGGSGSDTVPVTVGNVSPVLTLDPGDPVSFPGGDFQVVQPGESLPTSADGSDVGSDDLSFTWTTGEENTYYNDGIGPDASPSPFGTFPFYASDEIEAYYLEPGVELLAVTLTDDDGGTDETGGNVLVTGDAASTEGPGWWKHQYSSDGSQSLDAATAEAYRQIVNAVSVVFSEDVSAASLSEVHEILSPSGNDPKGRAVAQLMDAWLQFASGAVAWDATVPTNGGGTMPFLDVMFHAEEVILDANSTKADLKAVEQLLSKVQQAY